MEFRHHVKLQVEKFKNILEHTEVCQGAVPKGQSFLNTSMRRNFLDSV